MALTVCMRGREQVEILWAMTRERLVEAFPGHPVEDGCDY
jgi:hypothetical protein